MPVERELTPAIPRRRIYHEVIDVDGLDDEPDRRRPRRSAPQDNSSRAPIPSDIIILDSDDDSEPGPATLRRPSDPRLRSPPLPIQIIHTPPPVPPLPPRPRSQYPHVFPPDAIRPMAEPFAFERNMATRVTRPTSHPLPGNVPPSRHRPIINLGGGFISSSNQLDAEFLRRQQRDRARQRYFEHLRIARGIYHRHGFLSQTIGRIFPSWLFGDPTEEEMVDALAFSELAAAEGGPFSFGDEPPIRRTTNEYRVAYTHPYPPAPGFTHDFEPPSPPISVIDVDEEPGPSAKPSESSSPRKNESSITLVCARCLDPLVLGGSNMSEDERARCRLWGLRCGHMLDGKCTAELMKSHPTPELELDNTEAAPVEPPDDKSQGHSNQSHDGEQNLILGDTIPPGAESSTSPTRARGKARAIEQPSQSCQPATGSGERTSLTEDSSIRSRLRPRNNPRHPSSQRHSAPNSPDVPPAANTSHQSKNRPKGKGKQKAMERVILERHEWRCPVALCERLHLSLHIESQGWVMDETQGAIPIFA